MCRFLSWAYEPKTKKVLYRLGAERFYDLAKGENPDSHAYLAEVFEVDEDETAKFEVRITSDLAKELLDLENEYEFVERVLALSEYDGGILDVPKGTSPLSINSLSNKDIDIIKFSFEKDAYKIREVIRAYAIDLGVYDNDEINIKDIKNFVRAKLLEAGDSIAVFKNPIIVGFLKSVPAVKDGIPYKVKFHGDNEEIPIITVYNYVDDWNQIIGGRVYFRKFIGHDKYTGEDTVRKELRVLVKNLKEI